MKYVACSVTTSVGAIRERDVRFDLHKAKKKYKLLLKEMRRLRDTKVALRMPPVPPTLPDNVTFLYPGSKVRITPRTVVRFNGIFKADVHTLIVTHHHPTFRLEHRDHLDRFVQAFDDAPMWIHQAHSRPVKLCTSHAAVQKLLYDCTSVEWIMGVHPTLA